MLCLSTRALKVCFILKKLENVFYKRVKILKFNLVTFTEKYVFFFQCLNRGWNNCAPISPNSTEKWFMLVALNCISNILPHLLWFTYRYYLYLHFVFLHSNFNSENCHLFRSNSFLRMLFFFTKTLSFLLSQPEKEVFNSTMFPQLCFVFQIALKISSVPSEKRRRKWFCHKGS